MNYSLIYLFWSIYLVYMLNWFKTTWNFAPPISKFASEYLAHPVEILHIPINPVCKFGNTFSWIGAAGLICRGLSLDLLVSLDMSNSLSFNPYINIVMFNVLYYYLAILGFMLSLMNLNVTVYLLPILIFEFYIFNTIQIFDLTSK